MITRKFLVITVLGLIGTVSPMASATTPDRDCELVSYKGSQARPYVVEIQEGRNVVKKLLGAMVYVQAQQGLSAEYLQLRLQNQISAMKNHAMPNCPLAVDGASVSVSSAGNGYWVQIASTDRKAAEEILRRAELLVR